MTKTLLFARRRRTALCGASLSALILAIATPQPAAAQSFQGTGTVTSGTASISTGAGTTDVFVGSDQVVIDWTTTSAGSNVVFQPSGTAATFQDSGLSATNYTVLNRIVPVDGSGAPTNATVEFDGTVNSTLFGQVGGNVWFYSPNGVILGSTARFNVGGLVLTTNPIDTTGGLYGSSGEIRFAGAAGSLAPVTIQGGAQINALRNAQIPTNDAYVALVAPRIVQAGSVRSDGAIAYVAAEVADITINAGLFDINVTTGTTDANGIVHTGTTGGSASTSATDVKTIYMVAMGKNDGLTMLLNGGIGYDAAALATDDGSAVVLSAGHGLGFDTGDPRTATASITIGDAQFTSVTAARATDRITVAPTAATVFERFASLDAVSRVELNALGGAQITANDTQGLPPDIPFPPSGTLYSLDVQAGYAERGGTIAVNVDGGGALTTAGRLRLQAVGDGNDTAALAPDGLGGTIAISLGSGSITTDAIDIEASGYGQDSAAGTGGIGTGGSVSFSSAGTLTAPSLIVDVSGNGGSGDIGGAGKGGAVQLAATGGGTIAIPFITLNASGSGGFAVTRGGTGTGGSIDISVASGGKIGSSSSLFATTTGYGGFADILGGDGIGGRATITDTGGILDFLGVFADANGVGSYSDGDGGSGFGGTILVSLSGNDQTWNNVFLSANAEGGESFGGGISGSATADLANGARLQIAGVALNSSFVSVRADAYAPVNGTTGSHGRAGRAVIDVSAGGSLTAVNDLVISANADFNIEGLGSDPLFTPDMTGGTAALTIDNGAVSTPTLSVEAFAVSMGALTGAGSATGGTATVSVANGGSLVVDSSLGLGFSSNIGLNIIASASGAYETSLPAGFGTVTDGFAASARGGTASLLLSGGTIDIADAAIVEAQGHGGPSNTIGGANSLGSGTGGTAQVSVSGGTLTFASTLDVRADGIGGTIKGGATGGSGTGGLAAIDVSGGALSVNAGGRVNLTISADGTSEDVDPTQSGSSGNATGGQARLRGTGGNVTVAGPTVIRARGLSGAAGLDGVAGIATGGLALLASQNGGTFALNGPVSVLANALGGAGMVKGALGGNAFGGSASAGQTGTGTTTITGDLLVDASAIGGVNSIDSLVQGRASGGSAGLITEGGALQVVGNATLDANATGGTNPGGTLPPTVAGLLKIGSSTADPSGTLNVTGSLSAGATGDTAAAGGPGLSLRTANAALSVAGDATITTTGNARFDILGSGSFDVGGALTVTSTAGQITGTGLITSGGNALVTGANGISLGSLHSGGTTGLFAASGPVTVTDLLSTGPVTVSGLSVAIGSTGGLTFADADATAGNLSIQTQADLVVATVDATGAVTLGSANGSVTTNGAVNGTSVNLAAGQTIAVNALVRAGQITATSQDIAIGARGQIGQRGTTTTVAFTNRNGANTSYIGGAATTGGYSLDNGEFQRIFADNGISFAVQSGAGEVQVGTLGLGFGTGQAIGSGGTLSLASNGRISVTGTVGLATSSALDTLQLTAANIEVSTDLGSIALMDGSGNGLGVLRATAGRFVAATSGTIAQLGSAATIAEVNALMDTPGTGPTRGGLFAGAIQASVTDGIYIQNLGATTGYADRRGFTAGSLAIDTAGNATRIVVNGVIIDANGNLVTGLDTVSGITINGSAAAAGGAFDPFSTVNGCIIGLPCGGATTGEVFNDIPRTKTDIQTPVSPGDPAGSLITPPVIEMDVDLPQLQRNATLPLVDEPVTGVGNEDLWGNGCSPGEEGCAGGQAK